MWQRTTVEVARVAYLLGADIGSAQEIARKAFRHASFLWMDWRDPSLFNIWVLRFTIKAGAQRERLRGWLGRPAEAELRSADGPTRGPDSKLWARWQKLRLRHKAVLLLVHYSGLAPAGVADVLQTSVGGAAAPLARAQEELGAGPETEAELGRFLSTVAKRVPPPDRDRSDIRRVHRLSRAAGAAILVMSAGALVGAGSVLASRLGPSAQTSQAVAPNELAEAEGSAAPRIPASEFLGAPGWCPTVDGSLHVRTQDGIDAVGVATRLNLGLINGYKASVGHLVDRVPGAPPASSWPTTTDNTGLRVAFSAPAEANRVLAGLCGNLTARRTWEVVLEDPGPPRHDGVAFFLIRRDDGMKVWGTFAGAE
jgi:DNA-directed RNA polymerase specialized sigma24 family protein